MPTYLYPSGGSAQIIRDPDTMPAEGPMVQVIGSTQRAIDGSLRQHRIALKRRWDLSWTLLTDAELSTITAILDTNGPLIFQPASLGVPYTVVLVERYERFHDGMGWGLRASLEEV